MGMGWTSGDGVYGMLPLMNDTASRLAAGSAVSGQRK
jgi:hypothetical protein